MSSIVTAILKATIGLLVNKGRDAAAEKLKESDVTDEKIRGVIVRDLENIREKLDALSRKDLLASISFFKEGIEYLREVLNNQNKARSKSEYSAVTTQAACAEESREAYSLALAQGMKNLELIDLDESASRALFKAKKKFEDSGRKATEAFHNEALETSDRILAMKYRVMATILETIDNPADAIAPCKVCIEELNSLSAVQNSFNVQLKKGLGAVRGLFGKDERREIISNVCHVNRVIYDVTLTIGKDAHFWIWPAIDIGEDKIDPLRDERVAQVLRKQGMEHCCVPPWSLGQEGEEEHKLKDPWGIATNSRGHFIVGDRGDNNVKVFDSKGTFIKHFSLPENAVGLDVATDMNDNIYVLVALEGFRYQRADVYEVLNNTADLQRKFPLRREFEYMNPTRLIATDSGKFLVLTRYIGYTEVDVYESDGRYVWSFGKDILDFRVDVSATNDGRVVVVDQNKTCFHIISEQGDHLNKFKLQRSCDIVKIAFHRASDHIVVAGSNHCENMLDVNIYTKDGKFVRSIQIRDERIVAGFLRQITINTEGGIAVVCEKDVLVIGRMG